MKSQLARLDSKSPAVAVWQYPGSWRAPSATRAAAASHGTSEAVGSVEDRYNFHLLLTVRRAVE